MSSCTSLRSRRGETYITHASPYTYMPCCYGIQLICTNNRMPVNSYLLGAGRPQVLQGRWESRIVSDIDGTLALLMPLPYRALSTTGTMEAHTCRPVRISLVSYFYASRAFRTTRLVTQSSTILGSTSLPRFTSRATQTHNKVKHVGVSRTSW